jgi:uncharacterized membrane protein
MQKTYVIVILTIAALISVGAWATNIYYPAFSLSLLLGANLLLAGLSLTSGFIVFKTIHERPQAFVRGVYSGTLLKLFVCMAAMLIYILANKTEIYKPAIFLLFGVYAVYTTAETIMLSNSAKRKQ